MPFKTCVRFVPDSVNVSVSSFGAGLSLAKVDFARSSFQLPVKASAANNNPTDDPNASVARYAFFLCDRPQPLRILALSCVMQNG